MSKKSENQGQDQAVHHVYDWVWQMGSMEGIIPPFCVEVMLNDGSNYYLHSIPQRDEHTLSMVMRVWDFRSFTPEDVEDLKQNLNNLGSPGDLENYKGVHPKLEWADVRLPLANVNYAIEWNERVWPREDRPRLGLLPTYREKEPLS
ncbi:MAG: hypothetical protein IH891_03195 [Planctomycetes bacterium]|nr:hypothetical protein [Planctomycetota bacterium]